MAKLYKLAHFEKDLSKKDFHQSNSLVLLNALLNGKIITNSVFVYLTSESDKIDTLYDFFKAIPEDSLLFVTTKKKVIDYLMAVNFFTPVRLKKSQQFFTTSSEVKKYLLDQYLLRKRRADAGVYS